jgi:hypothetical protein
MWKLLRQASPNSIMWQLWGNHDDRLKKKVNAKAPELGAFLDLVDYKQFWRFDGVNLQEDSREEVKIDFGRLGEVWFQHGHYTKLGDHTTYNLHSTVVGHTHKAGLVFQRYKGKTLFEMNVGYVASQDSPVMRYTPQRTSKSIPGFGIINVIPQIVTF